MRTDQREMLWGFRPGRPWNSPSLFFLAEGQGGGVGANGRPETTAVARPSCTQPSAIDLSQFSPLYNYAQFIRNRSSTTPP